MTAREPADGQEAGGAAARPRDPRPLNLADYEHEARFHLSEMAYAYYAGGANDEITLRANRRAFDEVALRYRVLVDVSTRDLSTTVLGTRISMPVLVAPMALQRLACADGEMAMARAAESSGTVMVVSTVATCSLEEVRASAGGPLWFQLYWYQDRALTESLVRRAERAGYEAIVLTVDAPVLGRRERDIRADFRLPDALALKNLPPEERRAPPPGSDSRLAAHFATGVQASTTWRDLEWLRSITRLPLILKGVVRGDDARRAVEHGVGAIIVSNHGGRQLDGAVASIVALREVAAAVEGRVELLVDGGVRRGVDVVRAIALGARAVLLGRPLLWGLALGGESGARDVLDLVRAELDVAMALCGCATVADITPDLVA